MRYYITDKGLRRVFESDNIEEQAVLIGIAKTGLVGVSMDDFRTDTPEFRLKLYKSIMTSSKSKGYLTTDRHKASPAMVMASSLQEYPSGIRIVDPRELASILEVNLGVVPGEKERVFTEDYIVLPDEYLQFMGEFEDQ